MFNISLNKSALCALLCAITAVATPVMAEAKTTKDKKEMTVKKKKSTKKTKKLTQKQIDSCVDDWVNAYRSEPGWEDHPISYDQLQEWEDWCKKGRTPKNYKP